MRALRPSGPVLAGVSKEDRQPEVPNIAETYKDALGATVSRSDDGLVRYHGKLMIVDGRKLYVMGFNFPRRDLEQSRSLGVVTKKPDLVTEAARL